MHRKLKHAGLIKAGFLESVSFKVKMVSGIIFFSLPQTFFVNFKNKVGVGGRKKSKFWGCSPGAL